MSGMSDFAMKEAERMRARYAKHRAAGKCGRCGGTPDADHRSCAACRSYTYQAKVRHIARTGGAA